MSMQMFLSNGLQVVKLSFKGSSNDNKRSFSIKKAFTESKTSRERTFPCVDKNPCP